MDLMIVDMPEGLVVPGVSNPASTVPKWNQEPREFLQPVFDFADQHLQDDGALIIIYPFRSATKSKILDYCKSYGFEVKKDWWGMNRLHLTSPTNPLLTVSLFIKLMLTLIYFEVLCICFPKLM